MTTTCPQNVWNHTNGCSCLSTGTSASPAPGSGPFGPYPIESRPLTFVLSERKRRGEPLTEVATVRVWVNDPPSDADVSDLNDDALIRKGSTMRPDEANDLLTHAEHAPIDYAPLFEGLTRNPALDDAFLDRMAESSHPDARLAVAKMPVEFTDGIRPEVARAYVLMHDNDADVSSAANWAAFKSTGVPLTTDAMPAVGRVVPVEVLERMAVSEIDSHRIGAAKNPRTSRRSLQVLLDDEHPSAGQAARKTLDALEASVLQEVSRRQSVLDRDAASWTHVPPGVRAAHNARQQGGVQGEPDMIRVDEYIAPERD